MYVAYMLQCSMLIQMQCGSSYSCPFLLRLRNTVSKFHQLHLSNYAIIILYVCWQKFLYVGNSRLALCPESQIFISTKNRYFPWHWQCFARLGHFATRGEVLSPEFCLSFSTVSGVLGPRLYRCSVAVALLSISSVSAVT